MNILRIFSYNETVDSFLVIFKEIAEDKFLMEIKLNFQNIRRVKIGDESRTYKALHKW